MKTTIALLSLAMIVPAFAGPEAEHRGHWVGKNQWQMSDHGRNHGIVGGPGIPKCNPWVSEECRRLHPRLIYRVPRPHGEYR